MYPISSGPLSYEAQPLAHAMHLRGRYLFRPVRSRTRCNDREERHHQHNTHTPCTTSLGRSLTIPPLKPNKDIITGTGSRYTKIHGVLGNACQDGQRKITPHKHAASGDVRTHSTSRIHRKHSVRDCKSDAKEPRKKIPSHRITFHENERTKNQLYVAGEVHTGKCSHHMSAHKYHAATPELPCVPQYRMRGPWVLDVLIRSKGLPRMYV